MDFKGWVAGQLNATIITIAWSAAFCVFPARGDDGEVRSIRVIRWVSAGKANQYFLEYGRIDSRGAVSSVERRANYRLEDKDADKAAVGQWLVERQDWDILVPATQKSFPLQQQYSIGGRAYWTVRPTGAPEKKKEDKPKQESHPPKSDNPFADVANDALEESEVEARVITEKVAAQNKKAYGELAKTGQRRQQLARETAAARAQADAANAAASANLANAAGNLAAANANAQASKVSGTTKVVEQGSGEYVLEWETRGGKTDGAGNASLGEWTRIRQRYSTAAERDQAKASLYQTQRAQGGFDQLRSVRTQNDLKMNPTPDAQLAGSRLPVSPARPAPSPEAKQALREATQTEDDFLDRVKKSETAQRAKELLEKTNEANAETLTEKKDLNVDDIKDNLNQAAKDTLTEQAEQVTKEMIRDMEAMRLHQKKYDDLSASQGMSVDWEIMVKEAPSFGAMSKDEKQEWVGEKMDQIGNRMGQFVKEMTPDFMKSKSSGESTTPPAKKNDKSILDQAIDDLMTVP
jgi:hypothetical protein